MIIKIIDMAMIMIVIKNHSEMIIMIKDKYKNIDYKC